VTGIRQHDEFFLDGVRYYTQEQLDAAVAEAEQRAVEGFMASQTMQVIKSQESAHGYEQGQRDAMTRAANGAAEAHAAGQRDAIAKAVAAVEATEWVGRVLVRRDDVIAAIKAVGK
jgi:flagellar biosynthesis/type III secretory pathway protein FliH